MKQKALVTAALVCSALVGAGIGSRAHASDHDDGSQATAAQNTNLTDLLVYNEKDQNKSVTTNDLIFQMNLNARTKPTEDPDFSTNAAYDFHVTRVGGSGQDGSTPTGADDVVLRFEFGAPDAQNRQQITMTPMVDGHGSAMNIGLTTPHAAAASPVVNTASVNGHNVSVFAGTREDTFFFDVDQFLKVRDSAAARANGSTEAQVTFRNPGVDFTAGYNVLSIIARVPREVLQSNGGSETTFDVWETVSVKQ